MKTFPIGSKVYPIDNSYCINLRTGGNMYLAGTAWDNAQLVEIVSEPYFEKVNTHLLREQTYEFVKVKYLNEEYRVLNNFTSHFEDTIIDFEEI